MRIKIFVGNNLIVIMNVSVDKQMNYSLNEFKNND